ncbi:MAG TPA: DegT/DnrJ/EryC1/StrS family aminotransferase [Polyangia bacterium]
MAERSPSLSIPYVDLAAQHAAERETLLPKLQAVLARGEWVGGEEIAAFEHKAAAFCGVEHAIAVASGTDALMLSLRALGIGPGDEVITPPNSFVATTAAIALVGATPVFADVRADQNIDPEAVERAVTPRTRALLPVHLTGRMADMRALSEIARRHDLRIIEDAAQAIGSRLGDRAAGSFGDLGCFSAHPLKNLNAMGDAGYVVTNDGKLADRLRRLRNNGLVDRNTVLEWGTVSRLDTLQATVLLHRLEGLPAVIAARRENARLYCERLNRVAVFIPPDQPDEFNTFHTFVIQVDRRDDLKAHLAAHGVGSAIHYPVPIHLQPAARALGHRVGDFPEAERQAGRVLSLPVHPFLKPSDVLRVAELINGFFA